MVHCTLCTEMNPFLPRLFFFITVFITVTEGKLERRQTDNSQEKEKGAMATGILVNVTCDVYACTCVCLCLNG